MFVPILFFLISINIYSQSHSEKIYQMLWAGFDIKQTSQLLSASQKGVGGIQIIWGSYSLKDTREVIKKVYSSSNIRPFIAIDYEGGSVYIHQTHGLLNLPSNMALGVAGDCENTTTMFYLLGLELKKAGINAVFAPTLDVNTEKNNPIINVRAFGSDKETVTKMANSVIDGFRAAKIINVVKHFPGHGMTDSDSHLITPVVNTPSRELYETHIYPFKKIIENNKTDIVMLSHIIYKNIDSKNPASLSPEIIKILRKDLNFKGIILTDSMDMKAITGEYNVEDAAVTAIKNGVDMILIGRNNMDKIKNAIMNALKKGEISSERIEESYKRIIDIKNKYRLSEFKIENNEFDIAYKQIASDISRKSIKIVKGKPVNLKNNKIKMIFFVPQRFSKESLIIYEKMKRNGLDVDFTLLSSDKINSVEILNNSNFDTLIIANYSWPKMSEKRFKNIIKISQKFNKKIFINFLNPVDSQKINNYFDSIIETYGINEYSANAVANELREAGGEK